MVKSAELGNAFIVCGFLSTELEKIDALSIQVKYTQLPKTHLVARETQDFKTLVFIFFVQSLKP